MAESRLQWLEELPQLPRAVRMVMVIVMHVLLFTAAYFGAFLVRFDFSLPADWQAVALETYPAILGIQVLVFAALRNFNGWWRYVSLYDILELARALAIAEVLFLAWNVFVIVPDAFPRSIYLLNFGLALFLISAARGSLRLLREAVRSNIAAGGEKVNLLILGAGDTGETLLREISKNKNLPYKPVGYLDDDQYKRGLRIHGVPVLGPISMLHDVVEKYKIEQIIIAMPSASREQMRRVVDACKATSVNTQILPAVEAVLEGNVSLGALREISIDDLLGRDPVRLDSSSMGRFIQGQTVFVTGAGGSIGSEICRQVMRFNPSKLILIERGETPLFFIEKELRERYVSGEIIPCIADVADRKRMQRLFELYEPDVIVHAAAYKHVPLMERHPAQAVLNNVGGTMVMADLACEFEVPNFVLISTDKAVNPTSVMGATKRVTELYVLSKNRDAETHFSAVRFGNVLGSNGSVVPIFREQIRQGGPVTVTHPEMTRYFMTIPEASQLVLHAAALGVGGELFILDMGQPVKIADLARDMIRLSGLTEDDVEITFMGVRPGEKLFEELTLDEEELDKTRHDKIFVGRTDDGEIDLLVQHLPMLVELAQQSEHAKVKDVLKAIVPTYTHEVATNVVSLDDVRSTS